MIAQQRSNPLPVLLLLLLMIATAMLVATNHTTQTHAVLRHGVGALIVKECFDRNGTLQTWKNIETGRRARICELEEGKFGLVVGYKSGDLIREVSAFLKNKFRRLSQVERYLQNAGYQRVK